MTEQRCPACHGQGVTGEMTWKQVTREGGIWLHVVCTVCDGRYDPEPGYRAQSLQPRSREQ